MKARALLASLVTLSAGLIVFVFVQFRDDGQGGVGVGLRKAEAACTEASPSCLPRLTFIDTTGTALPPESLVGKLVVVNFWATWCGPCRVEIPDLAAVHDAYKDRGVVVLGVLTDQPSDGALEEFVEAHGLDYPVVRADAEMMRAFEYPEALPTTFVYDKSGHARYARPGSITRRELGGLLDDLLAE